MTQSRAAMVVVTRSVRAYFAPVSAGSLDLSMFAVTPPPGWIDLGWIDNLKRTSETRFEAVRAGAEGAPIAQFCCGRDAGIELDFLEWGKLQMALASGGQPMNVLASATAVPLSSQSSRTQLLLEAEGSPFSAGDLIAVDVDYCGQTGPVGSGAAAAYVRSAADVQNAPDYVRRVTLNVARVSAVEGSSISLQQPLPFAIPAGAKAQKVVAFADCESATLFPEWSALFVAESECGGRLSYYYPRLQPAAPAQEGRTEVCAPLELFALHATFRALPAATGRALCYRMYFPAGETAVY